MAKFKILPTTKVIHQPIPAGHMGEMGVESIEFDLTSWVETYGSGTANVIMQRWGDKNPYPIPLTIDENNKAMWTLSDTDTAVSGLAYAQVVYIVGDTIVKKSDIYTFRIASSLEPGTEPPDAYESWLDRLQHLAAEAMVEVLDLSDIPTDATLSIEGGIADAKAVGDALAGKADASTTYTKTEVDTALAGKADASTTYTKTEVNALVATDTTLAVSGKAADAKKTGDEIAELKADLGDLTESAFDAETVYDQLTTSSDGVTTINAYASFSKGGKIYNSDSYRGIYYQAQTDCLMYCESSIANSCLAVYNSSSFSENTCVYVRAKADFPTADEPYSVSAGQYIFVSVSGTTASQVIYISSGQNYSLKDNAFEKYNTLMYADITDLAGFSPGYINTSGGVSAQGENNVEVVTDYIPCARGQVIIQHVEIPAADTTAWGRYALYDDDRNLLAYYGTTHTSTEGSTKIMDNVLNTDVEDVAYVRTSFRTYGSTNYSIKIIPDSHYLYSAAGMKSEISIIERARFPSEDMFPINILHRGLATSGYPENTIAAFRDAIDKGWVFIETDIRKTSDDVWVLLHDSTINRTARNADGTSLLSDVSISSITYEQALEYDFGIYADNAFAGTKIATLEDFLALCRLKHAYPVIEVKNGSISQTDVDAVWALIQKHGMENRVFLLCSSLGGVNKFLVKNLFIPAICTSSTEWTYTAPENFGDAVPYAAQYKTGYNRVFLEREVSGFNSVSDMDNFIDYCHYHGIYAGFYSPTTESGIGATSDRFDMATTQYYQYSDVKAANIE